MEVSQPVVETPNTSETLVSTGVDDGSPQGTWEVPAIVASTPCRLQRHRTQPDWHLGVMMTRDYDIMLWESYDPSTNSEALEAPTPIKSDRDSMSDNQVGNLVGLPEGITPKRTDKDENVRIHRS